MHKKVKRLILILIGIVLCSLQLEVVKAKPNDDYFYNGSYLSGIYYKKIKNGITYYETAVFLRRSDVRFAYCLQPFLEFTEWKVKTAYDSDYAYVTNMKPEQWNRISLLAYYGYTYEGHMDEKWYAITQLLIWKTVDPEADIFFTDRLNGTRITPYDNEIAELERLVANHQTTPSFSNGNYSLSLGATTVLKDTNGVLSNYSVTSSPNVTTNIIGNELHITANDLGTTRIELTKNPIRYSYPPIVYIDNDGQDMLVPGYHEPITTSFSVQVNGGKIQITKVDSETNTTTSQGQASLVGAVYKVYNANNEEVDTLTIGDNKTAITKELPFGTYTIREVTSSSGYYLDGTVYSVTIDSTDIKNVTVKEQVIKGRIQVKKIDRETKQCKAQGGATLIGAKYGVYDWNHQLVDTLTIGNDCSATSKLLPYGNYEVKEIASSNGYRIDSNTYSTNIVDDQVIIITSEEDVVKGRIQIQKVDRETKQCKALGNATLVGAKYGIYDSSNHLVDTVIIGEDCSATSKLLPYGNYNVKELSASTGYHVDVHIYSANITSDQTITITSVEEVIKGRIKITKVDRKTKQCKAQGEATLVGAKYGVYDSSNNLVDTLTIGEDCSATSRLLPYGYYTIRELENSRGYYLNIEIYSAMIEQDMTYPVTVTEDVIQNDFEFYKFYGNLSTGFIYTEPNAVFEILNHKNQVVVTFKTDQNGYAKVTLPYGNYLVRQIAGLDDYKMIRSFTICVNEETSLLQVNYIKNGPITARLKLTKVDRETNQVIPIAGAKFKIKNKKTNEYVCMTTDKVICEFETNEEGIMMTPLPLFGGDYIIEEIQAPNGYLLSNESIEFSIKENSDLIEDEIYGSIIEIIFKNEPVKGVIEIQKVGEKVVIQNGQFTYLEIPLPNVKFALYDAFGHLIGEYVTDQDGYIKIENLKLGKYRLKEIETVGGYILDESEYEFELQYQDQYTSIITKTFTLKNNLKKSDFKFIKKDASTGEAISNVKIEIYTENNELIFTGVTDEFGQIELPNLWIGRFYIVEVEAATGYQLSTEKLYFEVLENGQIVKVEMTNERIVEVPDTAVDSKSMFSLIGGLCFCIGFGCTLYAKKREI